MDADRMPEVVEQPRMGEDGRPVMPSAPDMRSLLDEALAMARQAWECERATDATSRAWHRDAVTRLAASVYVGTYRLSRALGFGFDRAAEPLGEDAVPAALEACRTVPTLYDEDAGGWRSHGAGLMVACLRDVLRDATYDEVYEAVCEEAGTPPCHRLGGTACMAGR